MFAGLALPNLALVNGSVRSSLELVREVVGLGSVKIGMDGLQVVNGGLAKSEWSGTGPVGRAVLWWHATSSWDSV